MNGAGFLLVVGFVILIIAMFFTSGCQFNEYQTLEAVSWQNWNGEYEDWKTTGLVALAIVAVGAVLMVFAPD